MERGIESDFRFKKDFDASSKRHKYVGSLLEMLGMKHPNSNGVWQNHVCKFNFRKKTIISVTKYQNHTKIKARRNSCCLVD